MRLAHLLIAASSSCLLFIGGCSRTDASADPPSADEPLVMDSYTPKPGRPATATDVAEYLGPAILPIIAHPDDIVIHRIRPEVSEQPSDQPTIAGRRIIATAGKITDAEKAAWSSYAIAPGGFSDLDFRLRNPDSAQLRGCGFQPGLALIFTRGEARCTVLLCFSCREWRFRGPGPDDYRRDYFDGLADKLRALAHTAFPDDPAFAPRTAPPEKP